VSPADALEERRKKTTLRKVPRKHAGKITQPYAIMERLIKEVEEFAPLKMAKIIIVWKSGWKPTKDDILRHAQIRKLTELEREIWGDEYDLCMLLHRELWQSSRFSEEEREIDIHHEMLHPVPEVDDKTGDQKMDDRGRLCWRLRNHPIQRFPEEIDRYGLDKIIHVDETAKSAVNDELSQEEAKAEENDEKRPLLRQGAETPGSNGEWPADFRDVTIEQVQFSPKLTKVFLKAGVKTLGNLVDLQKDHGDWWSKKIKGLGDKGVEDASARLVAFWAEHPEYCDGATQDATAPDSEATPGRMLITLKADLYDCNGDPMVRRGEPISALVDGDRPYLIDPVDRERVYLAAEDYEVAAAAPEPATA